MPDLKTIFGSGPVTVEQLGGGLDKLNFAVHSPEGFFIWQLSEKPLNSERRELLEKLAGHMGQQGIVTRHLAAPAAIPLTQSGFRWMAVYRGVVGQSIPWSDYCERQIISAVKYLAKIHEAGRSFPGRNYLARLSEKLGPVNIPAVPGYRVNQDALINIKTRLDALNRDRAALTVLHGDFGRANIIFQGERVAGVVDFDRAGVGHPLFDLGRFTSYLLLDTRLSRATVFPLILQNYPRIDFSGEDLAAAVHWAWWEDWLAWRDVASDLGRRLTEALISSQLVFLRPSTNSGLRRISCLPAGRRSANCPRQILGKSARGAQLQKYDPKTNQSADFLEGKGPGILAAEIAAAKKENRFHQREF